jgi:transporter family-2 protein
MKATAASLPEVDVLRFRYAIQLNQIRRAIMADGLKVGLVAAVAAGSLFGIITAIEGAVARVVGGVNSSLYEHFFAGIIAIVVIVILLARGNLAPGTALPVLPWSAFGAVLVLISVAAISFAVPKTGVAVGNFALVLGQLLMAVLIDAIGFPGMGKIPLTPIRLLGLLVMVIGIYLVVPRQG